LLLLLTSALQLTHKKFVKLLAQSDMVNPQMIAHIFDLSPGKKKWLTGSEILTLLYRKGSPKEFCKSYAASLDNDIICLQDIETIKHLAEILNESKEFTHKHVVSVLTDSCLRADTFKAAGKFLYAFCVCLPKEEDASGLITEGEALPSYT